MALLAWVIWNRKKQWGFSLFFFLLQIWVYAKDLRHNRRLGWTLIRNNFKNFCLLTRTMQANATKRQQTWLIHCWEPVLMKTLFTHLCSFQVELRPVDFVYCFLKMSQRNLHGKAWTCAHTFYHAPISILRVLILPDLSVCHIEIAQPSIAANFLIPFYFIQNCVFWVIKGEKTSRVFNFFLFC